MLLLFQSGLYGSIRFLPSGHQNRFYDIVLGLLTGGLVAKFNIPAFIVTLGSWSIAG